ncbi:hypothetical protein BD413DRAFT_618111 [Trametes elegans]|nr:hypothetical protein BD413DRAFT_618111 [Trametes elegans]
MALNKPSLDKAQPEGATGGGVVSPPIPDLNLIVDCARTVTDLTSPTAPAGDVLVSATTAAPTGDAPVSAATAAHFGQLDVLVKNAGYALAGVAKGTPELNARAQFVLNFCAPVRISSAAVCHFREHNCPACGGRILNLPSSAGGFMSNPITKELDPAYNVRITVVQLGGPDSVIGDPAKGAVAKALVTLADAENPPVKIPLGLDARVVVQSNLAEVQRELDECKELDLSTVGGQR